MSATSSVRPCLRHVAQSFARHWQPEWPTQLERALRHPIAGPLIRAGAWRLARAEHRKAAQAATQPTPEVV
jgi:hypothetical protein